MSILKKTYKVTPDRRIVVDLPPETPLGEVEVEVRMEDASEPGGNYKDLLELIDQFREERRNDPNFRLRSKEEIDEYIRIERESWD